MDYKLISIIMPAYKAAFFIEETLNSVKNQTYPHWELIVVEDGSDDGTKAIVDLFKSSVSQKVIYYRNNVNKGLPATRNIAATMANGCWYAFLDSDDIWHEDHLLYLTATAVENPDYDLIYSAHLSFYENILNLLALDGIYKGRADDFILSVYNKKFYVLPSASMVTEKALNAIGGWSEEYRHNEDTIFYFKLLKNGFRFKYSGKATTYYRLNPNGLSRNFEKMIYNLGKVYEETIDWEDIPKKMRHKRTSDIWLVVARRLRKYNSKQAKEGAKKAVKYNPTLKTLFYLVLAYIIPNK